MTNAPIAPSAELRNFILRAVTAASHRGQSREELLRDLKESVDRVVECVAKPKDSDAKVAYGVFRGIAKVARETMDLTSSFLNAERIAGGESGLFDSRSLSCWLAVAKKAGVPAVPAIPLITLPEFALEILISPEVVEQQPAKPSIFMRAADSLTNGALSRSLGPVDLMSVEDKRKIHALTMALLAEAGEHIPAGHMVRHDHMGPGTLKAWAGIGWEPMNGDDGVSYQDETGRKVVLGPGWVTVGNKRFLDVTDARTVHAISLAFTPEHTFYVRPWVAASRRHTGIDIHRPASWPKEDRHGSWPAEWRVFIRGGKAVAVSSYYCWADIPGDAADHAAADEALRLAQKIADTATAMGCIPEFLDLPRLRQRSVEFREKMPEGTVNAVLDFIETNDGMLLIEGGPGHAHPCAFAGTLWPEGKAFRPREGINIADPKTWGTPTPR